ncbi:MAG TPA: DUF1326 domain-containing protein [bacterium]|nr:DUF1326 domain-containing protein [bacterium]
MAWSLKGTYFENCNCNMVCPCSTSGLTMPADNERCRVVLTFHIASGRVDGVDVGNLTVAVLADTPRQMLSGKWRVGVFMDAAASPQQAEKLGAVFSGQLGGPMAALAPLIGEMLGVEKVPIRYEDAGRHHRVTIGNAVDIEIEDFVPPQSTTGEVSKLTGLFHPANSTLTIARATKARVNAFGLEFSNDGKNGHSAPFSWAA